MYMLKKSFLISFTLVILVVIGCGVGGGGTTVTVSDVGNVEGTVTDARTNQPVDGVIVQIGSITDTTNASGVFTLTNNAVGIRTITAMKTGYQNYSGSVTVQKGTTVQHSIQLSTGTTGTGGTLPVTADLQGSWHAMQIGNGASPKWLHTNTSFPIDASGISAAAPYSSSQGNGIMPASNYSVASNGVVSVSGLGNFSGMLSIDKTLIVGTYSPNAGDFALLLLIKGGSAFTTGDLQGSWKVNQIFTGASSAWARADVAIDSSGTATVSNVMRSDGAGTGGTFPLSLNASGIVTSPSYTTFFGVVSTDKNLVVATMTDSDGLSTMLIFTRTGGSFVAGDIQGDWALNALAMQNDYWIRGLWSADTTGAGTLSSIMQSNGAHADELMSFTVGSNGVVLAPTSANNKYEGIMSIDKRLIIGTVTQDYTDPMGPEYALYIWMRSSGGVAAPVQNNAQTVTDSSTNRMWQKADDNVKRTWYDASTYCNTAAIGGYNDWRLPSMSELMDLNQSSIFNQIQGTYYAYVNGEYFGMYWSSTSFSADEAYHVFLRQNAGSYGYASKSGWTNLVRCVRP